MQPYHHFTLMEREKLYLLYKENQSVREIARQIGRSPSSISRELKRNCVQGQYQAWNATVAYLKRRKACKKPERFSADQELIAYTGKCLSKYWSPEIIVAKYKQSHPHAKLSHSTIYRAILKGLLAGFSAQTHLRRRNLLKFKKGDNQTIRPEWVIGQRPQAAHTRHRIGDWEGDTLRGGVGKGCLVTCVARKSRYLTAGLCDGMSAHKVGAALVQSLQGQTVHTLTLDRGPEFADFRHFQKVLDTRVYFADPRSPWQRASNENLNGLLRFFFPKGFDFRILDPEVLDHVLFLINTRPRKCLGWLSPCDFLAKCCT
jgi:IS30 family transposase